MIIRTIAAVAISLGLAVGTGVPSTPWAIEEDACVEGVSRCVWDATTRGNGQGESYILIATPEGGFTPRYVSHQYAHRLAMSFCNRTDVNCIPDKEYAR